MAYNGNDNKPTINTYSAISFSNNESQITGCSVSISYFNKMMVLTFVVNSTKGFSNQQDQLKIYLSYMQAKKLANAARQMFNDPKSGMTNVCIETKYGLLKISDGKEFNVDSPCISVIYITKDGNTQEIVYQTKSNYECAYNYQNGEFSKVNYPTMEIETFILALEEYYKAANYAIAASVHEASLYRDTARNELLRAIGTKVGARGNGNGNGNNSGGYNNYFNQQPANPNTINPSRGAGFSNQTFLANSNNQRVQNSEQFSSQAFDDFADSALSSDDD